MFYKDFATKIIEKEFESKGRDRFFYKGKHVQMPEEIKKEYAVIDTFLPNKKTCLPFGKFIKYGNFNKDLSYNIVLHARTETRYDSDDRNWDLRHYAEIAKMRERVCSVGSKKGSAHIEGTDDLRGIDLEKLCDVFASSTVGIGTSSGPMHLMSLCGLPHIVFTNDSKHKSINNKTNKYRYKKYWNPLGTKCIIMDEYGWRPPVLAVEQVLEKYLESTEQKCI